ncbi:Tetratricopeptide repeat-like superfamily protein [Quillaja saponaria]|uniref:Tetratricopeptide repeat-like superfamily protein n=1 Tax=Quillaja saponaria TaxID=32244 RepID=A0AAD7LZA7_QUISA|nr:Tetratricopeptide repeat-like superfamily protein [Quillaja saponaria]
MSFKLNKAIYVHAIAGLLAGVVFSSYVLGSPNRLEEQKKCNLEGSFTKLQSNSARTFKDGLVLLAIKFLHYFITRCLHYKYFKPVSTAPYTMSMPFWLAFTLSVSSMSDLKL